MGDGSYDQSDSERENEEMLFPIEVAPENMEGIGSDGDYEDVDFDEIANEEGAAGGNAEGAPADDDAGNDDSLECDQSAYVFNLQLRAGSPCLSFDVLRDDLGDNRADRFPLTMTLIAGTQEDSRHYNTILVMKLSNMKPSKGNARNGFRALEQQPAESESDSESEDEDSKPVLDLARIKHPSCVNRIKVTNLNGTPIAATWSESGRVAIWDLSLALRAVNNHHAMAGFIQNHSAPAPMFTLNTNNVEGFGLAWSHHVPGMLVTGDCEKNILLWKPIEGASWHVDQRPYKGHTASVEDIHWSPNESNVMASCSCDKTIRIWDIRAHPERACMLTKADAHDGDVNVISWNRFDPLILSGGDDGQLKIWDLRQFPSSDPVCTFKQHTAPITSVEWHPTDNTTFSASGADDQITLWDLSLERDTELEQRLGLTHDDSQYPPQLLFIHKGQKDIKELHWHPQMPGVLASTALCGFDVFRTISV